MIIGPTVDFRTCAEHYDAFADDAGAPPGLLEVHVPARDLDAEFDRRMAWLTGFASARRLRALSLHCPDGLQNRMLVARVAAANPAVRALADGIHLDPDAARRDFHRLVEQAGRLAAATGCDTLIVVHQGVYLPADRVAALEPDVLASLRSDFLLAAVPEYEWMLRHASEAGVTIGLETSPPGSANGRNLHVTDTCFEDVSPRLGLGGRFVFDTSHVAMCCAYFAQTSDAVPAFPTMDAMRAAYGGVPPSLASPGDFLGAAARRTGWFHLSDANGCTGASEGLPLGTRGALIDWNTFLPLADRLVDDARGVLELVDSHLDVALMRRSLAWLRQQEWPGSGRSHVSL